MSVGGPVSTGPVKVSASTQLICRLAIMSPDVREWLSNQTTPTPAGLDPELSLLEELLPRLRNLENPSPPVILALLPETLQPLVSGWELEKLPPDPLAAVKDAFRGMRLNGLKNRQSAVALELRKPGLTPENIMAVQKEILDLQGRINDLSAPAP